VIYCFDIDGVICTTEGDDYANAEPDVDVIERIKRLHEEGHTIRYYTGRGWGGAQRAASDRWTAALDLTGRQFKEWGLPGDEYGIYNIHRKPPADVYVDDKAMTAWEFRAGKIVPTVQDIADWFFGL
jgi:hypothetical protein